MSIVGSRGGAAPILVLGEKLKRRMYSGLLDERL